MSEEVLRSLTWVGLAIIIVAIFMLLEVLLRSLTNRFATPQDRYPHRTANQLPRVPQG
jgi:hypothetical protein